MPQIHQSNKQISIQGIKNTNINLNSEMRYKQHMTTQRPVSKKLDEKPCAKISLNFRAPNIAQSIKTTAAARQRQIQKNREELNQENRELNKSSPIHIDEDLAADAMTDFKLEMPQKASR